MKKWIFFQIMVSLLVVPILVTACSVGTGNSSIETELLSRPEKYFSVQYPKGYKVVDYSEMGLAILKKELTDEGQPRADINVMPNPFIALESAVDEYVAMYSSFDLTLNNIQIDGVPAVVIDGVRGKEPTRIVLCIYNDKVYKFNFVPADPTFGQPYRDMETLYNTIMGSFDFLPAP